MRVLFKTYYSGMQFKNTRNHINAERVARSMFQRKGKKMRLQTP